MSESTTVRTTTLDVRPLIAAGEEPFALIVRAADAVAPLDGLELIAPFEPVPLYRVLAARGFAHRTECVAGDEWRVTFVRLDIQLDSRLGDVFGRFPAAQPVIAAHGLDACCGGDKTLEEAARAHRLEPSALLQELHEAVLAAH